MCRKSFPIWLYELQKDVREKWGFYLHITLSADARCRELAVRVSTYAQVLKNCICREPH